jgi:hypothetical protein
MFNIFNTVHNKLCFNISRHTKSQMPIIVKVYVCSYEQAYYAHVVCASYVCTVKHKV